MTTIENPPPVTRFYALKIEQDVFDSHDFFEDEGHLGTMSCRHRRYVLGDEQIDDPAEFMEKLAASADKDDLLGRLETRREDTRERLSRMDDAGVLEREHSDLYDLLDNRFDARRDKLVARLLEERVVMLPLYLYDHGGITINTTGFHCPWDSGQVGWIHTTVKNAFDILSAEGLLHVLFPGRIIWDTDVSPNRPVFEGEDMGEAWAALKEAMDTGVPNDTFLHAVRASLRAEVKEFDNYLTGNVWGYTLHGLASDDLPEGWDDMDGDERRAHILEHGDALDSCWGFVGSTLDEIGCMKDHFPDDLPEGMFEDAWDSRFC